MHTALCRAGEAKPYLSARKWRSAVLLIKQKYLARPRPLSNIEAMKAMKAVKKKPAANPRTMKPLKELKVMKPKKKTNKSRSGSSNWAPCRPRSEPSGCGSGSEAGPGRPLSGPRGRGSGRQVLGRGPACHGKGYTNASLDSSLAKSSELGRLAVRWT